MSPGVRRTCLSLVLALGLWLRIRGVEHDLPFVYDPDEPIFVSTAVRMLQTHNPNPHWFGAPAITTAYMLSGLYGAIYAEGRVANRFSGPDDYRRLYQADPTVFYLAGRLLNVGFGLVSVFLVYAIARRLLGDVPGLMAGLFLAVSPLHVGLSQNVRMDVLMTFFLLLAFWFTTGIIESGGWRNHLLAGLATGLGVITKWPAAVLVPVLLWAHFLTPGRRWRDLGWMVLGLLVGSVLLAPWLVLDPRSVLADVAHEARLTHLSHTGTTFLGNAAWYVRTPLAEALSIAGLLLAAGGLLLCAMGRARAQWVLAAFPLCFLAFISLLRLRWDRWALPVIPFACILESLAIEDIRRRLARNGYAVLSALAGIGAMAAVAVPLGLATWRRGDALLRPHSITVARQWMIEHVPGNARVLVERYCPVLPFAAFDVFYVRDDGQIVEARPYGAQPGFNPQGSYGALSNVGDIQKSSIQFVALGSLFDRYVAEQSAYPVEAARYRDVMRIGKVIYDGGYSEEIRGPRIRVLQVGPAAN